MQNNGWDTKVVTNWSYHNTWKFIFHGLNLFSKHIALKVGNGTKVLFLKWDTSFSVLFSRLFRLTSYPMATIAKFHNTDNNWDLGFRRAK